MKIISAEVYNFASYKELYFEFNNQGLTLISGPTGSGKSTLCDIIPWILFGITAKDGSVDEIRSWNTEESTMGKLVFSHGSETYYIKRIRGNNNDLFYGFETTYIAEGRRGKDLADTQKQINQLIGINSETYLAAAYFHEFSQTAQFFTTSAKNRRIITEQLADLSLPKLLQEKLSIFVKDTKKELAALKNTFENNKNKLDYLNKLYYDTWTQSNSWNEHHERRLAGILLKSEKYDSIKQDTIKELNEKRILFKSDREKTIQEIMSEVDDLQDQIKSANNCESRHAALNKMIEELSAEKCKECGSPKRVHEVLVATKNLYDVKQEQNKSIQHQLRIDGLNNRLIILGKQINPYTDLIEKEKSRNNTYLEQLETIKLETNPHLLALDSVSEKIQPLQLEISDIDILIKDLSIEQADTELLLDVVAELRGIIIAKITSYLEKSTNDFLNNHFDAEIRIKLSSENTDKLEVSIFKDGNVCSYTQLSKGQRQLLKLCFGVSVMQAVSNHNGTDFNRVFFDECLDGMDDNIKAKSFTLLEKLSVKYESVFVVEHSEAIKSLFLNRYNVSLVNGSSQIEKQ